MLSCAVALFQSKPYVQRHPHRKYAANSRSFNEENRLLWSSFRFDVFHCWVCGPKLLVRSQRCVPHLPFFSARLDANLLETKSDTQFTHAQRSNQRSFYLWVWHFCLAFANYWLLHWRRTHTGLIESKGRGRDVCMRLWPRFGKILPCPCASSVLCRDSGKNRGFSTTSRHPHCVTPSLAQGSFTRTAWTWPPHPHSSSTALRKRNPEL